MTVSQVLYLLYKASSMLEARLFSVVLVNFKLLVPRVTSPEKVLAEKEVG